MLRPQAVEQSSGVELILHAGDVGTPQALTDLCALAPVVAVCGNNDKDAWADELPDWELVQIDGIDKVKNRREHG